MESKRAEVALAPGKALRAGEEKTCDDMRQEGEGEEEKEAEAENPFMLPSDDQVFLLRERERKLKEQKRERLKQLSVWEKTQEQSKRRGITHRSLDRALGGATGANTALAAGGAAGSSATAAAAAAASVSSERRREKENMTDFIAKKREMFLVQMSLDTKREEIRKLEEKAQLKEEALRKSELMLEEDAIRFDTFLKENDKKAHEAIKRAETETKLKQDKVQEIKKLNHQIQAMQSDTSKLKEQLEDCFKYKTFLDELTPQEWFEEQQCVLRRRKVRRHKAFRERKLQEYEEEKQRLLEEHEELKRREEARLAGKPRAARKDVLANLPPLQLPPPPTFAELCDLDIDAAAGTGTDADADANADADAGESKEADASAKAKSDEGKTSKGDVQEGKQADADADADAVAGAATGTVAVAGQQGGRSGSGALDFFDDELDEDFDTVEELLARDAEDSDLPMHFHEPQQLLNMFTQLEESNLFLIQNSQETEQNLDELKNDFALVQRKMDSKTSSLKANIETLTDAIGAEEGKATLLASRVVVAEDSQEHLLQQLNDKVKQVYKHCIDGEAGAQSSTTLQMLTDMEARLETLLASMEQMPEDFVVKAEKLKEKERRERVRAERIAEQQLVYETRLKLSIERSLRAPKKKTGKPVMFRSTLPKKSKVRKSDDSAAAEQKAQDMKEFFSW